MEIGWICGPGCPIGCENCIEQRTTGSIEGLRAAIDASERYEAALLDSVHTEEHVWAEFELAAQVVCPGGLILIHDARYRHGTVDRALQRIEAAGLQCRAPVVCGRRRRRG